MGVILDAAISNRPDVICIGDLNADILNPTENSKQGRTLLDICDIYDLHNLIMEPTRISSTRKSCLDVFLTNAPKFAFKSGTYESGLSDHMLIYTVFNTNLMKPKTTLIKGRSFKNFNEDEFNNDLRFVPFNVAHVFDDIDDICWAWEKLYSNVLDDHAPMKTRKHKTASGQSKFITPVIRKAIRARNALKRKYNKTYLFNIFMNDMIYAIRECKLLSYADDTKIYHSHTSPGAVELAVNQDLDNAATWFKENGMKANPDKYQAIVLGNNSQEISLKSGDINIPIKDQISLLGVTLDSKLKFDAHVAIICRKVSSQVNALNRLKNILPLKTKQSLYRSFILPHFYYCSHVWHHCGKRNTRKLEKVNERTLRYVFKDKISSYEQLLKRMSSQTLQNRRIQDMLCTINNCLSNKAPPSIKNLVSLRSCSYNLRGDNMLALPKVNTTKYGLKSWRYFATKIWNDLPNEIRATAGKNEFVRRIRTVNF